MRKATSVDQGGRRKVQLAMERLVWLLLVSFIWQAACAHKPPPAALSDEIRAELGEIGVISAQYTPAVEFELPAKGRLAGAARGFVRGTGLTIILVPSMTLVGAAYGIQAGVPGVFAGGFLFGAVGALTGAGYFIGGPIHGAVAAPPRADVTAADTQLKEALIAMKVQETMRDHVARNAQSRAHVTLRVLEGEGPQTPSDVLTYLPLKDSDVDTVLELRVTTVRLKVAHTREFTDFWSHPSEILKIDPPLALVLEARGRLIRTKDRTVLYDRTWSYQGGARTFTEWGAEEGKPFAEEFERAYAGLANQTVEHIFAPPATPATTNQAA